MSTWKRPYLIQRAEMKNVSKGDIVGIDYLMSFEYMGSAEFEFGALPRSLKRMASEFNAYKRFSTSFSNGDDMVHIICKSEHKDDIIAFLEKASKESYGLNTKEVVYFKEALAKEQYTNTNVWWDLENNWFAVLGKENAKKVMIGVQKFKEKKGI